MEPDHDFEDADADGSPEAQLEDIFLVRAVGFQQVVDFGADVKGGVAGDGLAGVDVHAGICEAGGDPGDGDGGFGEEAEEG